MKKNIYLTVTSGRSGTKFLQQIFNILPNFTSVHELSILYNGFWIGRLNKINKLKTDNYIETSHLICKGWIEPLLELNIIPRIIILKRNLRDIAKSLYQLNTIPKRTNSGKLYLLIPNDKYNNFNDYQLCYWYCLEIEQKQKYYKNLFKSLNGFVFETSIDELKDKNHFLNMLNYFNINYNDEILNKYRKVKNIKFNEKKEKKKLIIYNKEELNKFESEVNKFFILEQNNNKII